MILTKQWVFYIIFVFLLVNSILFLFNVTIDPYGKQNHFCDIKYKPVLNERGQKYNYIFNENNLKKYDSLILGSSRVMKIVPSNSEFTKKFYNFGVHVANNKEKLFILKEWLKSSKLKTLYLGIDYYNFHKNKRPTYIDYSKFYDGIFGNYLSISTFKLSLKSLMNMLNNRAITYFNEDGSINYFNKDITIKNNQYDFSKENFKNMAKGNIENNMIKDEFIIEENVFGILKEIKLLSDKNNIELKVFITPAQSEEIKYIQRYKNLISKYKYIDDKLVDIFGEVYNFYNINIDNDLRSNYYDIHHYREQIGNKIVKRINGMGEYGLLLKKQKTKKGDELNAL